MEKGAVLPPTRRAPVTAYSQARASEIGTAMSVVLTILVLASCSATLHLTRQVRIKTAQLNDLKYMTRVYTVELDESMAGAESLADRSDGLQRQVQEVQNKCDSELLESKRKVAELERLLKIAQDEAQREVTKMNTAQQENDRSHAAIKTGQDVVKKLEADTASLRQKVDKIKQAQQAEDNAAAAAA